MINLMSDAEVIRLVTGGGKTTATALRVFAALALVGGVSIAVLAVIRGDAVFALYPAGWGVLSASILSALAWVLDLLRGLLAGVWHSAWQLGEDEEDEFGPAPPQWPV